MFFDCCDDKSYCILLPALMVNICTPVFTPEGDYIIYIYIYIYIELSLFVPYLLGVVALAIFEYPELPAAL